MRQHPASTASVPHPGSAVQPVLLRAALEAYLEQLADPERAKAAPWLQAFARSLGTDAPLLAYTRLTGEAWRRTLPASQAAEAGSVLDKFRAFLREGGWFDAARPVNLFD